ncbi:MAG: hypothetical protein R3C62_04205 [Chloroflexota bacterium]
MSATGVIFHYEKRDFFCKHRCGNHEKRDGSFSPTTFFSLYVILNVVATTFNATAVISRPTLTNTVEACQVQWTIPKLTNADDFDIYVHIPDPATALNATYTIHHANQESTAIVVQAAYPNEEHDAWAYIGRYNFLADETIPEYVVLSNETTDDDFGSIVVADAIRLIPTNPNTVLGFTHNDTPTTTENTLVTIDVLANDEGTGLNIMAVTQADHGTVTINNDGPSAPADISGIDTVTYTPTPTPPPCTAISTTSLRLPNESPSSRIFRPAWCMILPGHRMGGWLLPPMMRCGS